MTKQRFYIDTQGNDDEAYREAMQYACRLADNDNEIKRVIILVFPLLVFGLPDQQPFWVSNQYNMTDLTIVRNNIHFLSLLVLECVAPTNFSLIVLLPSIFEPIAKNIC